MKGQRRSPETIAKIRAAALAQHADPEKRARHRAASNKGWTSEARAAAGQRLRERLWRREPCVYCGAVQRMKDLTPDGPGIYACADQPACEARILAESAA